MAAGQLIDSYYSLPIDCRELKTNTLALQWRWAVKQKMWLLNIALTLCLIFILRQKKAGRLRRGPDMPADSCLLWLLLGAAAAVNKNLYLWTLLITYSVSSLCNTLRQGQGYSWLCQISFCPLIDSIWTKHTFLLRSDVLHLEYKVLPFKKPFLLLF